MIMRKRLNKKKLIVNFSILLFFILFLFYKLNLISTNDDNVKKINSAFQAHADNSKFTVCIDPGHGDNDNGTKSASNIFEQDVSLSVSLKVGKLLEENNINVIYTRTSHETSLPSDTKLNLRERVKISNENNANIFISIHCNGSNNTSYKGIETWCRFPNTEGESLAKKIQQCLVDCNYSTDRGIKYESDKSLAVLRLNNSVSALIELGFLTNPSDAKFITSEEGQDACAQAICKSILDYKSSSLN